MKDVEHPVVFIGFPASSFEKWVPKEMERCDVDNRQDYGGGGSGWEQGDFGGSGWS